MSSSEDEDVTGALAWLNLMNAQHQQGDGFGCTLTGGRIPTNMAPTKYLKN
jgi:hypothetical protein